MKGKKTGGRVKGVPNKRTLDVVSLVAKEGITPLDYMLKILRDETAQISERIDAAKSAAPYIHSKMPTALVMPPPPTETVEGADETLLDRYIAGLHDGADES
jgi:hypothetical protein